MAFTSNEAKSHTSGGTNEEHFVIGIEVLVPYAHEPHRLDFGQCILDKVHATGVDEELLDMDIYYENKTIKKVTFSKRLTNQEENVLYQTLLGHRNDPESDLCATYHNLMVAHSEECPCRAMTHNPSWDIKLADRPVKTASVVMIQDARSGAVLFTRRPSHMRAFPGAWVMPGGAVDPGESLKEAGAREVLEETGINVLPQDMQPLCVWESVYPTIITGNQGDCIKSHVCVVFFLITLDASRLLKSTFGTFAGNGTAESKSKGNKGKGIDSSFTIVNDTQFNHDEVDHIVWIPREVVHSGILHKHTVFEEYFTQGADPSPFSASNSSKVPQTSSSSSYTLENKIPSLKIELDGVEVVDQIELQQIAGIYPNNIDAGIGQAHLFALGVLERIRTNKLAPPTLVDQTSDTASCHL